MNIILYLLALAALVLFGGFAVYSHREKETRAFRISLLIAATSMLVFLMATLLGSAVKLALLSLLGAGFFGLLVLSLLPVGKVEIRNDIPSTRFDERDIMFARARLVPGTPQYHAYYQVHPERKGIDDATRAKPGLLSPRARLANPLLFASPEASFTLTGVMGEMVSGSPSEDRLTLPVEKMTSYIMGLARYYGALEVGVAEMQPYHVYSHIGRGPGVYGAELPLEYEYAIAFTVEMAHEMVATHPHPPGVMESAKQYVEAGRVAVQLAAAIRHMGYPARAHIDGNYRVIAPLVARDAGLGEIGRIGLLMTPRQGPRVRLGVVTTNLELLVDGRSPDMSVIDFCTVCKKCAENCPSRSIPFEARQDLGGAWRWRIDPESCFLYWNVIGTDCGICMSVCPYSHPDSLPHNLLRWGIKRSGFIRRAAFRMDDLFYGVKPPPKSAPGWMQVP